MLSALQQLQHYPGVDSGRTALRGSCGAALRWSLAGAPCASYDHVWCCSCCGGWTLSWSWGLGRWGSPPRGCPAHLLLLCKSWCVWQDLLLLLLLTDSTGAPESCGGCLQV